MGIIGHWFKHKHGVALSLMACGSSIGSTIFPIATLKLIPLVGCVASLRTENTNGGLIFSQLPPDHAHYWLHPYLWVHDSELDVAAVAASEAR